jgi:hypothetical protein
MPSRRVIAAARRVDRVGTATNWHDTSLRQRCEGVLHLTDNDSSIGAPNAVETHLAREPGRYGGPSCGCSTDDAERQTESEKEAIALRTDRWWTTDARATLQAKLAHVIIVFGSVRHVSILGVMTVAS